MKTYAYGFPRLGENREFKKVTENFWNKKISEDELMEGLKKIEENILSTYQNYVDKFPLGEMTKYDKMLDTACSFGLYECGNLDTYYELARGKNALELTKWFNANYHYLVPDFSLLDGSFIFKQVRINLKEGLAKYKGGIPYVIGPFTFLKLSKGIKKEDFKDCFFSLTDIYYELLNGFKEIHIDEPAFVMELSGDEVDLIKQAYSKFKNSKCRINLFTYYDSVDFLKDLYDLPVKSIGLDFVNGKENIAHLKKHGFPEDKTLIAGIVNGRNIWRTDIKKAVEFLKELNHYAKDIVISNAGPLYHLPITIEGEELSEDLIKEIAFAKERLYELKLISKAYEGDMEKIGNWNKERLDFGINEKVRDRVENLKDEDFVKLYSYPERHKKQKQALNLPLFPTTTIGSFPQDGEVRKKRAQFKNGQIDSREYKQFIKDKIADLINFQEEMGLDVLVHGEFERTDMVEFFAQKLEGIATTKNGWIISYGTRVYRPPVIYGDVSRPNPITLEEISFAQSLTGKPLKGMFTGPITIIAWSFVRDDIPIYEVAYQIGLCLQDEIKDYESEGIKIIQIDEPAFRERAPLKKRDWSEYFDWAVKSFNLTSQSKPETQIHTHMCYSEFGDIVEYILKMDFDVITIEASRSKADVIKCFQNVDFKRQIGLGVWDIHSPNIPDIEDMAEIVKRALKIFSKENFWINPDCGLKTRGWKETRPALGNLVELARKARRWE